MAMRSPARPENTASPWALWFAAGVAPLAWSVHLLVAYWFVSVGCGLGEGVVKGILIALTAGIALLIALSMLAGHRFRDQPDADGHERVSRVAFMGEAGLMLGGLFLIGLVFALLPILILEACP